MKIGLISRGRTQSTALSKLLARQYNLKQRGELYFVCKENTEKIVNIKTNIQRKQISHQESFDIFKDKITGWTNTLFLLENFICKIWPSMLVYDNWDKSKDWSFDYIKSNTIFDISYYFNISSYDHLYFLDSDLKRSTLSWIYAKKTQIFHLKKNKTTNDLKINLDENDFSLAKFYILEYHLQQKIKEFLLDKDYKFTEIVYDENNYISDTTIPTVKNNYDYNLLIEDSNQLLELIDVWSPCCMEQTKSWYFY